MMIKNISNFKNTQIICVGKDVCYQLIEAGFYIVNTHNGKYYFIKTKELSDFLEREGVSIE